MRPELLAILERVRMSRHVPDAQPPAGTPETAPGRHVPDVPAVPAGNGQGEELTDRSELALALKPIQAAIAKARQGERTDIRPNSDGSSEVRTDKERAKLERIGESASFPVGALPPAAEPRAAALTRPSAIPAGTSGTSGTSIQNNGLRVPAADPGAGTCRDMAGTPRYRAWRCRFADGRSMTVLHPGGMDHAEALEAVARWPGATVEPLAASRVEGSPC